MFNWVAQIDIAATCNIRDIMSRSKKKTPASTCCCCMSQKRGKQFCNRKFRRRERMMISKDQYDRLPNKPIEVTDPWDLGGDGKTFWGFNPNEEWFIHLMRKWIIPSNQLKNFPKVRVNPLSIQNPIQIEQLLMASTNGLSWEGFPTRLECINSNPTIAEE